MLPNQSKPPKNARRIMRVADLPDDRQSRLYEIDNDDGAPKAVFLSSRKRQLVDLLLICPVYCASPVRLSDTIFLLRTEDGVEVETKMYPGDPIIGSVAYGVYFLTSRVRRLPKGEAAA